jgi:putative DNA primase/helicase
MQNDARPPRSYEAEFSFIVQPTLLDPWIEDELNEQQASMANATSELDPEGMIRLLSSRCEPASSHEPELAPLPEVMLDFALQCLQNNEHGDGQLFAHLFRKRCIYDPGVANWYLWRGHYWEEDWRAYTRLLISGPLASVYQKASTIVSKQPEAGNAQGGEEVTITPRQSRQLGLRADQLRSLTRSDHVMRYASTLVAVETKVWDANPWVLGTRQGAIDLRTGRLRAGLPDDYIRTIIPTAWKGLKEPAPRFERFLREIFDDRPEDEREELIAFLQRALGYGITGSVNEHIFLMLYGEEGRNGKDTLMHVLAHVLGRTVGAVSEDVLIAGGRFSMPGTAKPHLCSLQGKRIAWASEPGRGAHFAVNQIKLLTGGETIVARQLYGKEFTFQPSHLLILLTNHKPEADSSDRAFWERLCPITFNIRFVEKPERSNERLRDTNLARELKEEASGILAWLVRGALDWNDFGLAIPSSVRRAREEYRNEESNISDFVQESCLLEAEAQVPANMLYKRYKTWSVENALEPVGPKHFAQEIRQVDGVTCQRNRRGKVYVGITLAQHAHEDD